MQKSPLSKAVRRKLTPRKSSPSTFLQKQLCISVSKTTFSWGGGVTGFDEVEQNIWDGD